MTSCQKKNFFFVQILKDFLSNCLRQSEKRQKRSIVFNAFGTGGFLCYPKDVVAKLMYNAITDFDARQPRTWLKDVTFCVYGQDKDTVRVGDWLFFTAAW